MMRSIKNSSSTSQLLRFGCQNVRSLLDYTKPKYPSEAPPRRTAVCNLEFRRTGAAIVALSESCRAQLRIASSSLLALRELKYIFAKHITGPN